MRNKIKKVLGLLLVGVMFATNTFAIDPPTIEPESTWMVCSFQQQQQQ